MLLSVTLHSPCLFDAASSLQIPKSIYISDFNSHAKLADINLTVQKVLTVVVHFKNTNSSLGRGPGSKNLEVSQLGYPNDA